VIWLTCLECGNSIKSLLIFFLPILIPRGISLYRSIRNAPKQNGLAIKPLSRSVARVLGVLSLVCIGLLVLTIPIFAPENIFRVTQSRLQIPVDVLFTRLSAMRPNNTLTEADNALRARFVSLESRLLYLQYGPDVVASCPFCNSSDPDSFMYYAIPALLVPHVLNLVVICVATSDMFAGHNTGASGWRTYATIAAATIATADLYLASTYSYKANARALRLEEIDFFFWTARTWRYVTLAALNAVLGFLIYLTATNRAFPVPRTPSQRLDEASRKLTSVKRKLNATGVVHNTTIRDDDLRQRGELYWLHEGKLMREAMEEREVVESVNNALEHRIDIEGITRDADSYAEAVLQPNVEL
jgi:hypothetical protein